LIRKQIFTKLFNIFAIFSYSYLINVSQYGQKGYIWLKMFARYESNENSGIHVYDVGNGRMTCNPILLQNLNF